ncbi:ABC transporter ATP-binding protein [Heliobacterium chlorum]|uniref:ABC transporter ATP-binding protein n=1 Tax=Heliobacterium chlorum TaxID=2698 RepID=UPI003C6CAD5D
MTFLLAIETCQLTKTYQGQGGCRDISLAVPSGCIFGLLGPNGAGKSTLVKMLVGLLSPTSGEAKLLGRPIEDVSVRKKVGFLPETFRYHDWLSGEDLLRFHGSLFGMSSRETKARIPEVLHAVGLADQGSKRVGGYSKGMQQRIGLACALLPDPDLLFLDEPTSALDPIGRKEVRDLLASLRDRGKTIFLNSHLLSELETVCDQIAIIKKGQLLFQGDWRELAASGQQVKVVVNGDAPVDMISTPSPSHPAIRLHSQQVLTWDNSGYPLRKEWILTWNGDADVPALVKGLVDNGLSVYEVTPISNSLEELFLQYVSE